MILFDLDALECAAAQKSATAANPARPANPPLAAVPEPQSISGISGISDAGGFCFPERSQPTAPAAALLAGAEQEPVGHCPACGSPSWWRAADGTDWRCSYCSPRPQPLPEGFESLTLASGQWAPGTAPPVPEPVTVDDLLTLHGPVIAGCRTLDVLEQADDSDLPDLRDRVLLEGFARALVTDHRVRPLPPAGLPPLERLACEIGDDPAELRRWLDQTAAGRRGRAWLERTPGAADRALLALRADPDGPLLLSLDRARTAP